MKMHYKMPTQKGMSTILLVKLLILTLLTINKQILIVKQMRSLSVKEQPTVNFTYKSSPTKITSNYYTRPEPDIIINRNPNPNPTTIKPNPINSIGHIQVVPSRQQNPQRQRRHRIFEEMGLNRMSKSKERNRSYTIFNGIAHESTNKIKDMVFTKQSCKQKSVQTEQIPKQTQTKISTFNPQPQKEHGLESPLQIRQVFHQNINDQLDISNSSRLQQSLLQKQREVKFLKLELQRHQRCNKLTAENESIYRRLVERLDQISHIHSVKDHNHSMNMVETQQKIEKVSPHSAFSQTTRFVYPSSQKKHSNQKYSVGSILGQAQIKNIFEETPAIPAQDHIKTVTFQKTHHNRILKNQMNRYPSPFVQQNQSLSFKRSDYARLLASAINLDESGTYDRLSEMNRQLQGKVVLRSELKSRHQKHPLSQAGRERSVSGGVWHGGSIKYLL